MRACVRATPPPPSPSRRKPCWSSTTMATPAAGTLGPPALHACTSAHAHCVGFSRPQANSRVPSPPRALSAETVPHRCRYAAAAAPVSTGTIPLRRKRHGGVVNVAAAAGLHIGDRSTAFVGTSGYFCSPSRGDLLRRVWVRLTCGAMLLKSFGRSESLTLHVRVRGFQCTHPREKLPESPPCAAEVSVVCNGGQFAVRASRRGERCRRGGLHGRRSKDGSSHSCGRRALARHRALCLTLHSLQD